MKVENDSQIIKQKKYNKVVEKKCIESKNQVKKAFLVQVQGSSEDCHLDNDYISMVGQSFKKELEKKSVFNKFEICFICVESFIESAIPLCNHRSCQKCSLRLRALYNNMNCVYCKTFQPNVIFSKGLMNYNDFELEKLLYRDKRFGIFFETRQLMESVLSLLNFNCPKFDCDIVCNDWQGLKKHVKSSHEKYLCELCIENKKVFAHEHILFSANDLLMHIKKGDYGKKNKTGFRGHPDCGFCKKPFYDDDDLYKHCREFHERCHVCDQMAGQLRHQYYLNYDSLEKHFRNDHYICPEMECLEKRFIVFGTEFDLRAHQLEVHKNNLSSRALKEAKKIPVSFVFDCPATSRYFKGKNIVNTSNELQNYEYMTRAEKALRRQEENALRESRGVGLFSGDTILRGSQVQPVIVGPSSCRSMHNCVISNNLKDDEFPELGEKVSVKLKELSISNKNNYNSSFSSDSFLNCDSGIISQHSVVLNNISKLLNDTEKINQFWSSVSAFSNSTISAVEFVDFLLVLFNQRPEEINKTLFQIAELVHDENKKSEFLIAWNDWKINKQTKKKVMGTINYPHIDSSPSSSFSFPVKSATSNQSNPESFFGSSYAANFPSLCSIEKKSNSRYFCAKNTSDPQNVWNFGDKRNIVVEKEETESKVKGKKKNKKGTIIFRVG